MSKQNFEDYSNYNQHAYPQQTEQSYQSHPIVDNTTNQYNTMYNYHSQFSFMSMDGLDTTWCGNQMRNNNVENLFRYTDKVENIEITSKDLSPVSFCSNIDMLMPDLYKNKMPETQLGYNCNQQNNAIIPQDRYNKNNYCQELQYNNYQYNNVQCNTPVFPNEDCFQTTSLHDSLQFSPIVPIENNIDLSNDESDIVVEDSDDDITEYNIDIEHNVSFHSVCFVCNNQYGVQCYALSESEPISLTSQTPILKKLGELIQITNSELKCLCSECLNLINTIDHLQYQLESCKYEFNKKCQNKQVILSYQSKQLNIEEFKTKKIKKLTSRFNCKGCKKMYTFKNLRDMHMKNHEIKKRYLCRTCLKRFKNRLLYDKHLQIHKIKENKQRDSKEIKTYSCDICNGSFLTATRLKDHRYVCSGILPFKCKHNLCNKKFPTVTKLKYHMKLKHDKKFTSICSICNIGFVKTSTYKAHMISHSTEKKFSCTHCSKNYKTLNNLNFHLKFHDKKLPFICTVCNKGFMRKEYLESHSYSHNGVKKYQCHVCEKRFTSQKNLDVHLKRHDGTKKKCNLCGKFTADLENHLRTHTNLKEFNCDICDFRFNTKNSLYKHKKRRHC